MNHPSPDLKLIYSQAAEIESPTERSAYLDEACGPDIVLRGEVERLLLAGEQAGSFMHGPAVVRDDAEVFPSISEHPGTVIGPYKLLQQIGEGGMGVVFMAEQTAPIQRTVALKIIKPGMDTRQVIARFEAERQALAMMDHPNIARVLDVGATDAGRPYFVMDLVKGVPITDYCDAQHLPVRKRLELMADVCQAVQHAHQKGIIHRDLKPSNVLVAEYDGKPVPKIIDFGVAKATAQRLTEKTMFTELGQMVGTVEYMSPEQSRFNQLDIDTRSDIYSLGVLLYELLTGSTPFGRKRLNEAAFDEMLRIIREEEPPKPSTRLSSSDALPSIAANRGLEPLKLNRLVQGELDWIVMKALEKDRERRYETASGFAADLQRYLNDEAVQACPPSAAYRFRKFARRYRGPVLAATLLVLALLTGIVATTWQATRATRAEALAQARLDTETVARQHANAETATATAVSNVLLEMLDSANPDRVKGIDYTVLELLDDVSERLSSQLVDQPEVEAKIRTTIGRAYRRFGINLGAERNLKRALELRRRVFGPKHEKVADSLVNYAPNCLDRGRIHDEEALSREALAIYQARGVVGPRVMGAYQGLLNSLKLQKRNEEADAVAEEALARAHEWQMDDSGEVAIILGDQARIMYQLGKFVEGEKIARRSLELNRRVHGDDHGQTAWALRSLASNLIAQRKYSEAESALREALAIFRRYHGEEHKATSYVIGDLRRLYSTVGNQAGLEALAREQVERVSSRPRSDEPYPWGRYHVGRAHAHLKQWKSALDAYEQAFVLASGDLTYYRPFIAGSCLELLRAVEIDASLPDEERTAIVDKLTPRVNELWSETISEPPKSPLGKRRLVWSVVANPSEGFTDFHTAIALAQQAVAQEPKNAACWDTLGVAHYRAGDFPDAIKALQESTELSEGDNCIARFFLAMAHWQLGDKDEARNWYKQATEWMDENNPNDLELRRFRSEVAELLGITEPKPESAPVQPADPSAKADSPITTSQPTTDD